MNDDQLILLTIVGMAIVTALTRFTGYWLVGRLNVRGRLAGALEAVPGAILISIITPSSLSAGPAEAIAAVVTVFLALRLPALAAIGIGVATVIVLRNILS